MFAPSPQEQSLVERRDDVLCYTTPELKEDVEVTGPLMLHLFAATSARDTDFTAKLVDVYPDGRDYNVVCDGIIRARYRKSLFAPELVTPGEVNEYVINLEAVSQLFRKGFPRACLSRGQNPARGQGESPVRWNLAILTGPSNPLSEESRASTNESVCKSTA